MEEVKDYVGKNQRILDEWRAKFIEDKKADESYAELYFANDGIMNKGEFYIDEERDSGCFRKQSENSIENEMWSKAPLRVLFLTKDENISSTEKVWDVRRETFHLKDIKIPVDDNHISPSTFYKNEANILYGILNTRIDEMVCFHEFSYEDAVKFSDEVIFARINCKKEGGDEKIENIDLQNAITPYYDNLKKQIIALDADIFICCGNQKDDNVILNTLWKIFKDEYHEEFEYIPLRTIDKIGTGINYHRGKNKLAIDAYHLAYLNGGEELRYYDVVGAYYEFIKYLKATKGIDFTKHR
jgi:hypothetical protein